MILVTFGYLPASSGGGVQKGLLIEKIYLI